MANNSSKSEEKRPDSVPTSQRNDRWPPVLEGELANPTGPSDSAGAIGDSVPGILEPQNTPQSQTESILSSGSNSTTSISHSGTSQNTNYFHEFIQTGQSSKVSTNGTQAALANTVDIASHSNSIVSHRTEYQFIAVVNHLASGLPSRGHRRHVNDSDLLNSVQPRYQQVNNTSGQRGNARRNVLWHQPNRSLGGETPSQLDSERNGKPTKSNRSAGQSVSPLELDGSFLSLGSPGTTAKPISECDISERNASIRNDQESSSSFATNQNRSAPEIGVSDNATSGGINSNNDRQEFSYFSGENSEAWLHDFGQRLAPLKLTTTEKPKLEQSAKRQTDTSENSCSKSSKFIHTDKAKKKKGTSLLDPSGFSTTFRRLATPFFESEVLQSSQTRTPDQTKSWPVNNSAGQSFSTSTETITAKVASPSGPTHSVATHPGQASTSRQQANMRQAFSAPSLYSQPHQSSSAIDLNIPPLLQNLNPAISPQGTGFFVPNQSPSTSRRVQNQPGPPFPGQGATYWTQQHPVSQPLQQPQGAMHWTPQYPVSQPFQQPQYYRYPGNPSYAQNVHRPIEYFQFFPPQPQPPQYAHPVLQQPRYAPVMQHRNASRPRPNLPPRPRQRATRPRAASLRHQPNKPAQMDRIRHQVGKEQHQPVGHTCLVCYLDLSSKPEGYHSRPGDYPDTAVLPCGHGFHDHCLQKMNLPEQAHDPHCPICNRRKSF